MRLEVDAEQLVRLCDMPIGQLRLLHPDCVDGTPSEVWQITNGMSRGELVRIILESQ